MVGRKLILAGCVEATLAGGIAVVNLVWLQQNAWLVSGIGLMGLFGVYLYDHFTPAGRRAAKPTVIERRYYYTKVIERIIQRAKDIFAAPIRAETKPDALLKIDRGKTLGATTHPKATVGIDARRADGTPILPDDNPPA